MSPVNLASPLVSADIVTDPGGRVQSLVDQVSGRELLYQRTPAPGPWTDYITGLPGGWDDMFPNDEAWEGHPEHGRVWSATGEIVQSGPDSLRLRTALPSPPVQIERSYSLLAAPRRGLRLEERLRAQQDTGPFLWSSHPMLKVAGGWRLSVDTPALEVDRELPGRFEPGAQLTGDELQRALTSPAPGEGWAEVLYARVEGPRRAEVTSPDGHSRTLLTWSEDFFRNLWVVTVTGVLEIDLCLVLEPCTTRPYRLPEAIAAGEARSLRGGEERTWWVELESLDR
jgi:hypothetical protein